MLVHRKAFFDPEMLMHHGQRSNIRDNILSVEQIMKTRTYALFKATIHNLDYKYGKLYKLLVAMLNKVISSSCLIPWQTTAFNWK
jgi:GT2 family glycosyltransferase